MKRFFKQMFAKVEKGPYDGIFRYRSVPYVFGYYHFADWLQCEYCGWQHAEYKISQHNDIRTVSPNPVRVACLDCTRAMVHPWTREPVGGYYVGNVPVPVILNSQCH